MSVPSQSNFAASNQKTWNSYQPLKHDILHKPYEGNFWKSDIFKEIHAIIGRCQKQSTQT